jgi:hypothetical protein
MKPIITNYETDSELDSDLEDMLDSDYFYETDDDNSSPYDKPIISPCDVVYKSFFGKKRKREDDEDDDLTD